MQAPYGPPEQFPLQDSGGTVVVSITEPPKDHIVWSMANLYCGNLFCLGLVAFYYSIKSRDRKVVGDMAGAKSYGVCAYTWNFIATMLLVGLIIYIVYVIWNMGSHYRAVY